MTQENILINVDNSLLENSLDEEHIIQKDAYKTCIKLLREKLTIANKYASNKFDRFHETITVLGERGTGKTSFILSMKNIIDNSKNEDLMKIQTMDILDPTLLSDRQLVLITIVSSIRESVESFINNSNKINEYEINEWNNCLLNLAEGLNSIVNIGSNPNEDNLWDDAGLVLEKGLTKAKAGVNFEKEFHRYVEKSLLILNKKAFLLILDDIDTDFKKGWDVLEALRKYISTPHIITIISGDLNLYTKLIRQRKIELFKDLIKFEEKNRKNYISSVDSLQEQYLIKILKPENYINLHSLNYYLTYKKDNYKIKIKKNDMNAEDLSTFVDRLFSEMFYSNSYSNIFLNMPIRTNIQLFKAFLDSEDKDKKQQYFFQRLKDIFITIFFNFGIDMHFFELLREDNNINNLLSTIAFNEKIDFIELFELKPNSSDNDLNTVICIISGIYNAYFVDKPYKFIEWILKITLTKELFKDLEIQERDPYLLLDNNITSEKRILRYLGYMHDRNYLFVKTYKHLALINPEDNEGIFKKIKEVHVKTSKEFLMYLPYYEVKTKRSEIEDRFSFLFVLTFLEKLYSLKGIEEANLNTQVSNYFKTLLNGRIIKIPKLINEEKKEKEYDYDENEDENESEVDEDIIISFNAENDDFIKNLKLWLDKIDFDNSKLKLQDINSLFTNFLLRNINVIKTSSFTNLNEYFTVVIYSFLNELLVVSYENNSEEVSTFREIKTFNSAKTNFNANYNIYKSKLTEESLNDYSDIFISILNCPLWYYYLEDYNSIVSNSYTNVTNIKVELSEITIHSTKMGKNLFKNFVEDNKKGDWNINNIEVKCREEQKKVKSHAKYKRPFPLKTIRDSVYKEVLSN